MKVLADTESLSAVADAIRAKSGGNEKLSFPDGFADEIEAIEGGYDKGYSEGHQKGYTEGETKGEEQGYSRGYGEGYTKGKDDGSTFYNAYWDEYLDNGTITDCASLFCGVNWTDKTFKPKYDITPTNANDMFASSAITDINKCLKECGAKIDLSTGSLTKCSALMSRAKSISCPSPINVENVPSSLGSMFYNNDAIQEVHFIGVKDTHTWGSTFQNCYALKYLTIDGVIGNNISFHASPSLTNESVQSVINALYDYTGETAHTLSLYANVKATLTEEQLASITQKNWTVA